MQARIRKEDLTAFRTQAADIIISKKDVLPVLIFLKVKIDGDFATITKSNNRSFIIKTIPNDSEDCEFLVDEETLYNFLDLMDGDYVNFSLEGVRIVLTAGRAKMISGTDQPHLYPKIDLSNENWIPMTKLSIVTAGICSKLIMDGEIMDAKSHVFAGNNSVSGTDANIGYYQHVNENLPNLVLRKEVAQCMSKMSSTHYGSNLSYDLFRDDQTLYGFSKSEYPFCDLGIFFTGVNGPNFNSGGFSTAKSNIARFCQSCVNSGNDILSAIFQMMPGGLLHLEMVDAANNLDIHKDIPIKGESAVDFKFNPEQMNDLLKVIPSDDVFFWPGVKRYFITDKDRTFTAVIMGVM